MVAIKRLGANVAWDVDHARALVREAMAYARIDHPAVLRLHEFVEHAGRLALVLEYVDGLSLKRLRALLAERDAKLSDGCVLFLMAEVFAALAAAHAARDPETDEPAPVVHRDVSPANVLVARDGAVKLGDFGIARVGGVAPDTRAGVFKGTFGYMAPEQVIGGPITPATDVYSACLLLRELLLGYAAFPQKSSSMLALLRAMAVPELERIEVLRRGVPPEVCALLATGLAAEPSARTVTAAEAHAMLARLAPVGARAELAEAMALVRPRPSAARANAPTLPELEPARTQRIETPNAVEISGPIAASNAGRVARGASIVAAIAFVGASMASLVVLRGRVVRELGASSAASAPPSAPSAPFAPFAPSASSAAAPPALPPAPAISGTLVVAPTKLPHRVFVDDRVVGESSSAARAFAVRCGEHSIKVGSRGTPQSVTVPCGGSASVAGVWIAPRATR